MYVHVHVHVITQFYNGTLYLIKQVFFQLSDLEVVDSGRDVLVAGGLRIGQSDCLAHRVEEGGAATGQVGGACYDHLQALNLLGDTSSSPSNQSTYTEAGGCAREPSTLGRRVYFPPLPPSKNPV